MTDGNNKHQATVLEGSPNERSEEIKNFHLQVPYLNKEKGISVLQALGLGSFAVKLHLRIAKGYNQIAENCQIQFS